MINVSSETGENNQDVWDDDEIYLVYEKIESKIPNIKYTQISSCGGVIEITKTR